MAFQNRVNGDLPPAFDGDFGSMNPRHQVLNPFNQSGAWWAGQDGVYLARFVWCNPDDGTVSNHGTGTPSGFAPRWSQTGVLNIGEEASMHIRRGQMVTVFDAGDFAVQLPQGGTAARDAQVTVDVASGMIKAGGEPTNFVFLENGAPGEVVKISSFTARKDLGSSAGE